MTSEGSKVGRFHVDKENRRPGLNIRSIKQLSYNPDLITLQNCQYNRSRHSRALKPLDIQTLIIVGGGSNPNFLFSKLDFFLFDAMAKQTAYRYSTDAKVIIRNTHDFCKREKEDGHRYHYIR